MVVLTVNLTLYELTVTDLKVLGASNLIAEYDELSPTLAAIVSVVGVLAFILLTYALALTAPMARELLAGQRYLPEFLKAVFRTPHITQRLALRERRIALARLKDDPVVKDPAKWVDDQLTEAHKHVGPHNTPDLNAAAQAEAQFREVLAASDVIAAVRDLLPKAIQSLARADVACHLTAKPAPKQLIDRGRRIAKYLSDCIAEEQVSIFWSESTGYPHGMLAPTRLGNVAAAVRSQMFRAYGLDIDFVWSRLENALPSDNQLAGEVRDAKAKLDAMVLLCFSAAVSTGLWLGLLTLVGTSVWQVLLVGILGPAAAAIFYRLAVQSYLVFGDAMRSAVDLHRFELMKHLRVALPADSEAERKLWDDLHRAFAYGEGTKVVYQHPQ